MTSCNPAAAVELPRERSAQGALSCFKGSRVTQEWLGSICKHDLSTSSTETYQKRLNYVEI